MDDAFIEELYEEQTSLHHLNETSASGSGKTDLGPLPPTAVTLLSLPCGSLGADPALSVCKPNEKNRQKALIS